MIIVGKRNENPCGFSLDILKRYGGRLMRREETPALKFCALLDMIDPGFTKSKKFAIDEFSKRKKEKSKK